MTREEISEAVSYIKTYRKLDENLHNTAPKGSEGFYATEKCLRYWDMAIKALEQEPCGKDINVPATDAISRQAALDAFGLSEKSRKYGGDHSGYDTIMLYEVQDALEALPPVTPQPKTGHWVELTELSCAEYSCYVCSECEAYAKEHSRRLRVQNRKSLFCPDCGLKMIEPQKSEDKE